MSQTRSGLLRSIVQSPLLAGINVVFGVAAGLLGAIFHQELAVSVPLVWFSTGFNIEYGPWNATATWFWGLLLLFASVWAAREAMASTNRRREMISLEELIENPRAHERNYSCLRAIANRCLNST